jgi:glycosyltransferase involved in cell wall biosynthesis
VRLLIITSAIHYKWNGVVSSYGPYTREIDVWADLFSEVVIAAPVRIEQPPGDCVPFLRSNISLRPQVEVGGDNFASKIKLLKSLPRLAWNIGRAIRTYDAVHVRCPGNLGFIGTMLAPLLSNYTVAKYAGQWNGYSGESVSARMQRYLLKSRYWNGPVTVYGNWPEQPAHVIPFFTSIMTQEQVSRATAVAQSRRQPSTIRILFVGRLSKAKNVDILIEALTLIRAQGHKFLCSIIGEGPERQRLENLAASRGLSDCVYFAGGLPHEEVLDHLACSDVLVLASMTEGWPKSIAEAMTFGLICIGSDQGFVPDMLADGRGLLVTPRDIPELAEQLANIAAHPESFNLMRLRASEWAQGFSLDKLREAIKGLLTSHWQIPSAALSPKLHRSSENVAF